MQGVNKVILLGRVGKEPQRIETSYSKGMCALSLATSNKFTDANGIKQEKTEWHNLVAFSKNADLILQYVKKGTLLYCEGSINNNQYEKDGVKKSQVRIVVEKFNMIPSGNREPQQEQPTDPILAQFQEDDDIPF